MPYDISAVRQQFPALQRQAVFFDNPGGTQVARQCLERMTQYLTEHNANDHGAFLTSRLSDAVIEEARTATAEFLNAARPEEIIYGANMTSMTMHISRSIARTWQPGDEIVVTDLDHDANRTPWILAAEDRGCSVRRVDFHVEDGTLDMQSLADALQGRPRLLAVGMASNALGTINPIKQITKMAHAAGALVYVDAVHYAPHGPIDVQELDCDFLVCSAYKFFGPHLGILYGKYELLDELTAYKVRPASNEPPDKFETGTGNFECIAGHLGSLEYLEWLGDSLNGEYAGQYSGKYQGRALKLKRAMSAIRAYEFELSRALLDVLEETPPITVYGLNDRSCLEARVPTVSFTLKGWHPRRLAEELDEAGINAWNGNYYAVSVAERLGVEEGGGMVRVGPVHYNTVEEIQQFGEALGRIAQSAA